MYKKLFSDSAIYGFGAVLIKSIGFFTLPIYTRIFTPVEYGIIEMFATIAGILSIMMTMGLDSAQSFYFMEAKNKKNRDPKAIISAIMQLRLIIGGIIIPISVLMGYWIVGALFPMEIPIHYFWIVLLSTFFGTLVGQCLEIFRLMYKAWHFIALSFVQSVIGVLFILYFVYFQNQGLEGYFLGTLSASAVALGIAWIATQDYRYWVRFDPFLWKKFLRFGIPLLPAGLMVWVMNASDRWFVMHMLSAEDLGLFAIGAKFSLLLAIVIQTFRRAWWPIAMDMIHKPEGPVFFKTVALWYITLGSIGSVILTMLSPVLVEFLAAKPFYESWKLVGLLSWGSIFYGFFLISTIGVFVSKKTYLNIHIHGFGALANIALNYVLILRIGLAGAAIATALSILISNIYGMILSNRFFQIDWQWGRYFILIMSSWIIIFWYVGVI